MVHPPADEHIELAAFGLVDEFIEGGASILSATDAFVGVFVNNVLTVLNVMLKKDVEWDVIERVPCTLRLLPIPRLSASFHNFWDYERLVEVVKATDSRAYLIVLLCGEAGLRCGEMMALEWADVDLVEQQLCVQRSEWKDREPFRMAGGFVTYH